MLHGEDLVGEIFEDRRSEGINLKAFTVQVVQLPPSLEELRTVGIKRFASVVPESSAAPRKRTFDDYRMHATLADESIGAQLALTASSKRQRVDRESDSQILDSDQPIVSTERDLERMEGVVPSGQWTGSANNADGSRSSLLEIRKHLLFSCSAFDILTFLVRTKRV